MACADGFPRLRGWRARLQYMWSDTQEMWRVCGLGKTNVAMLSFYSIDNEAVSLVVEVILAGLLLESLF